MPESVTVHVYKTFCTFELLYNPCVAWECLSFLLVGKEIFSLLLTDVTGAVCSAFYGSGV